MICGKCKNKIESGLESCPFCGARFKKRTEGETPSAPIKAPEQAAPQTATKPQAAQAPEVKAAVTAPQAATPPQAPEVKASVAAASQAPKPAEQKPQDDDQLISELTASAAAPAEAEVQEYYEEPVKSKNITVTVKGQKPKRKEKKEKPQKGQKPTGSFLKKLSPWLEMLCSVLAVAAFVFLLIGIVTAKIILFTNGTTGTIEGFIKINAGLTSVALVLGLASAAAALLKIFFPAAEGETSKGKFLKMLVSVAFSAGVIIVSLVSLFYSL